MRLQCSVEFRVVLWYSLYVFFCHHERFTNPGRHDDLIAEKNPEVFAEIRRDNDMKYAALMEVMKEDVEKKVSMAEAAKEQQTTVTHINDIMTKLKYTAEQAMDLLSIPQSQRSTYAGLVGKRVQ